MQDSIVRRSAGTVFTALALGLVAMPAAASPYLSLYAYGDSLTDNGNLYALSAPFAPFIGGLPVPSAPYVDGRFSNGPVAVEYLASGLGATLYDYAVAGAKTDATNGQFPPALAPLHFTGLLSQVSGFTAGLGAGGADSQGLYFVWAGANDFLQGGFANPLATISSAVDNLETAVRALHTAGARDFLLPNLVNLGLTPRAQAGGPAAAAGATAASIGFNQALMARYASLAQEWSDETFYYFDAFQAVTDGVTAAPSAGINASVPCVVAGANPACTNYYFFDDVHPTTLGHAVLGAGMLAAVVPEPASMLLVATALLGLVGASRRRATRRAA